MDPYSDISTPKLIAQVFLCWVAHWIFVLVALVILAAVALCPLWVENWRLRSKHELLVRQNGELRRHLETMDSRIAAIDQDPQYAERITRRELNLRKPGTETLEVAPGQIPAELTPAADAAPAGSAGAAGPPGRVEIPALMKKPWFRVLMRVCMDEKNRLLLMGLSGGLFLAAILISIGQARLREGKAD